jgi:hypothetical protein
MILKEFNIQLRENEVKVLVDILGDLPTKIGVYNILSKIVGQVNLQIENEKREQDDPEPV